MNKTIAFLLSCFVLMQLKGNHYQNSKAVPAGAINALIGDISFIERFGSQPTASTNYNGRIKIHLEYVEEKLRAKYTAGLTEAQRSNRLRMLDLLHTYRMAGRFPRNYDYKENRPCFIDKDGNICAVGYLVEQTAGRKVAEQINARYKYEYLLNMQDETLESWITASGLTKEECAMIQPTYDYKHEIPIQPILASKITQYEISLGYGIANQPSVNDMYRGLNVYEIHPKSKDQMQVNIARHFWVKRWNIITGIGIRREDYTTDERYKSIRSKSSASHYSAMASVSFLRYFRLAQKTHLFYDAGINFQLNNLFYSDRGLLLSGGKNTYTSQANGHLVQKEELEYSLYQKSRYFITPQATFSVGIFSRIKGMYRLKTSLNFGYDMLKSSYLLYQFKTDDKVNNVQYAVNKDSRAISRAYFSVKLGYLIHFKKTIKPAS